MCKFSLTQILGKTTPTVETSAKTRGRARTPLTPLQIAHTKQRMSLRRPKAVPLSARTVLHRRTTHRNRLEGSYMVIMISTLGGLVLTDPRLSKARLRSTVTVHQYQQQGYPEFQAIILLSVPSDHNCVR